MPDDSYNFDDVFEQTPAEPAMTEARVRAIASDQNLRDLAAWQQAAGAIAQRRAAALERAEQRHLGFTSLYNNPQVTSRYWQDRPRTARLIGAAESGLGDEGDVDELYDSFYNQASQYQASPQQQPQQSAIRGVKQAPGGPFSLDAINALPLGEERHQAIQNLKEKVGDVSIDEADPNSETFKIERGGR